MSTSTVRPAVVTSGSPMRLTCDDHLFVAMDRVLGFPVVNQAVWLLGADVDELFLTELAAALRAGRLSRLVVRSIGPTRDRWRFAPEAGEVHFAPDPVAPGEHGAWARARLEEPLDTVVGPVWRLSGAPTTDGATLVSLTFSHVVADGGAMLAAVGEAVAGGGCRPVNRAGNLGDSLVDGLSLTGSALSAGVALLRGGRGRTVATPRRPDGDPGRPSTCPQAAGPPRSVCSTVAVTVDDTAFESAAARLGGTPNSLLVALVVGILEATGRVRTGDCVPVGLPMSLRDGGAGGPDARANATSAATARIRVTARRYRDLRPIRQACREAFVRRAADHDPVASTAVLAQALPDRVVRLLASGMTMPLALASNLGELPAAFSTLGSRSAGPAAIRSVTTGLSPRALADMGGGVNAWLARSAGLTTLSFTSLDPVSIPDEERLCALVTAELGRRGLAARTWLR